MLKIAPLTEGWNNGQMDWSYVENPTEAIEHWEKDSGFTLPPSYREFMIRYNGGYVYPRLFKTPLLSGQSGPYYDDSNLIYIDPVYCWKTVEINWNGEWYGRDPIPENYLLIAGTPAAIELLLSLNPNDFGYVYSWRHSVYKWGSDENSQIHLQAQSFAQFLEGLFDDNGEDYENWYIPAYENLIRDIQLSI